MNDIQTEISKGAAEISDRFIHYMSNIFLFTGIGGTVVSFLDILNKVGQTIAISLTVITLGISLFIKYRHLRKILLDDEKCKPKKK